jgi:hypothetical protein
MVSHCRGEISLSTSAQLIQSGFDYDQGFKPQVARSLTNYLALSKGSFTLTDKDRETVDLLFEITKNEGERHGKMPSFRKTSVPDVRAKVEDQNLVEPAPAAPATPVVEEPPSPPPVPNRRSSSDEDEIVSVIKPDFTQSDDEAAPP